MCSVAKPCLTLCDSVDCSLPDSPFCKIFQTRILEWVAFAYFRGSSWPRGWTRASCISYKASEFFTIVPPGKPPCLTSSYPMYMRLTKRFGHCTEKPEWTFWPTQCTHTCIYIYITHFHYPFFYQWTFMLLPCLGCCKYCCRERWGACIFFQIMVFSW